MTTHTCVRCKKNFKNKAGFDRHTKRKIPCVSPDNQLPQSQPIPQPEIPNPLIDEVAKLKLELETKNTELEAKNKELEEKTKENSKLQDLLCTDEIVNLYSCGRLESYIGDCIIKNYKQIINMENEHEYDHVEVVNIINVDPNTLNPAQLLYNYKLLQNELKETHKKVTYCYNIIDNYVNKNVK